MAETLQTLRRRRRDVQQRIYDCWQRHGGANKWGSLTDAGIELGLTRERVRQVVVKVQARMADEALAAWLNSYDPPPPSLNTSPSSEPQAPTDSDSEPGSRPA